MLERGLQRVDTVTKGEVRRGTDTLALELREERGEPLGGLAREKDVSNAAVRRIAAAVSRGRARTGPAVALTWVEAEIDAMTLKLRLKATGVVWSRSCDRTI